MMMPSGETMRRVFSTGLVLSIIFCFAAAFAAEGEKKHSPCEISYPSDVLIPWTCHRLKKNESLESLFGDRWQSVARFNRIDRRHALPGTRLKTPVRLEDVENFAPVPAELAYEASDKDPKFILIDLTEQFLGAYENGVLIFSSPIASGKSDFITPPGEFRIDAYSGRHESSLYTIEDKDIPYPMHYGLRFLVNEEGIEYWIHGRDMPGYPASHGCIGLYDEDTQKEYYDFPDYPLMDTARKLFEWAIPPNHDVDGKLHPLKSGPRVLIVGEPPGGADGPPNIAPGP